MGLKKLLFICMGNTCRSPMAEGIFQTMFKRMGMTDVNCDSAGWCTFGGQRASKNAVLVCEEIGVDISRHISKSFSECDLSEYEKLIFIDVNVARLAMDTHIPKEKIVIMNRGLGIPDPYGGDVDVYRRVREIMISDFFALLPDLGDVSIAAMHKSHISQIAEIEKQSFSRPWTEKGLSQELDNPNAFFYVACVRDVVLGYVGLHCVLDEGFIANIAVLPIYRGKGVASKLLEHLEIFAKERSLSRLTLEVRKSNTSAIGLYKKFGFAEDGIRKNFYSDPTEDALIMSKYYIQEE